ncbi:MAG: hypothetical protein KGI27_15020 [Thaumarchaeota archaeon]|nr:hypothetical protein [Nitrososphaerota archaeon]
MLLFVVFFMGHKGSMEAKYTTNKGILPQLLIDEMLDVFARSEEFLDLEKGDVPKIEQKEIPKEKFQNLTQEEHALLQNLLQKLGNTKSAQQTTTNA